MPKTPKRERLERQLAARKQGSIAQLLLQTARVYNERASARVRLRNPQARIGHTRLLPYIDLDGTRQSVVARRAGISKQAVGQLVDELIALGYVQRSADPEDRRASLVRFTDEGLAQLLAGFDVLDAIERELLDALGERTLQGLRRDLARVLEVLQGPA